jgi:hypothetical protein
MKQQKQDRVKFGFFYYRFVDGESAADTYSRCASFVHSLHYRYRTEPELPDTLVIAGHGLTNRLLIMRMLGMSVEWMCGTRNPKNCEAITLTRAPTGGGWLIDRELCCAKWATTTTPSQLFGGPGPSGKVAELLGLPIAECGPQERGTFLKDEWLPLMQELKAELTLVRTRALVGVSPEELLPAQSKLDGWTERMLELTRRWHGRPNVCAMYEFMIEVWIITALARLPYARIAFAPSFLR